MIRHEIGKKLVSDTRRQYLCIRNKNNTKIKIMEEYSKHFTTGEQKKDKMSPVWIKSGAAFAGGMVGGFGGALLLGGVPAAAAETPAEGGEETGEIVEPTGDNSSPWTDGTIPVAHGINDGMSFGQAFAAARAEVGPGGVFEWRGGVYGTFNAQEWNSMSPAERNEWSSHFNWSNVTREPEQTNPGHHGSTEHETGAGEGNNGGEGNKGEENKDGGDKDKEPKGDEHETEKHEYEIISVQEGEDGSISAYVKMDGHNCVLIDRDGDGVFDVKAVDLNDDETLQDNEMMPIDPSEGLTVEWAINQIEPVEPPTPDSPEIEITDPAFYDVVSVYEEDGVTTAVCLENGVPCVLIDTDGDGIFDAKVADENYNGDLMDDQIIPIHADGLTVEWAKENSVGESVVEPVEGDDPEDVIIDGGEEEEVVAVEDDEEIVPDDPADEPINFDDI